MRGLLPSAVPFLTSSGYAGFVLKAAPFGVPFAEVGFKKQVGNRKGYRGLWERRCSAPFDLSRERRKATLKGPSLLLNLEAGWSSAAGPSNVEVSLRRSLAAPAPSCLLKNTSLLAARRSLLGAGKEPSGAVESSHLADAAVGFGLCRHSREAGGTLRSFSAGGIPREPFPWRGRKCGERSKGAGKAASIGTPRPRRARLSSPLLSARGWVSRKGRAGQLGFCLACAMWLVRCNRK